MSTEPMKADMTSSPETMNTNNNINNPMQDQINKIVNDQNLYLGRLNDLVRDYRRMEDMMLEHIWIMREWKKTATETMRKIDQSVQLLEDRVDELTDGENYEMDADMDDREDQITTIEEELSVALMERDEARRAVCEYAASRKREDTGKNYDPMDAKRMSEQYGWDCFDTINPSRPDHHSRAELDAELPYAIKNEKDLEWIRHLVARAIAEAERNVLKQTNRTQYNHEHEFVGGASGAD
jgi:hypothetical protein